PASAVKFTVDDPRDAHAALLANYTDADMHDVLAYLQTLKSGTPAKAADGGTAADATPAKAAAAPGDGGGLDPATLLHPPSDTWPTYHGDYSGRHHSALTEITRDNVHQLALAWTFQTGQADSMKATPILVNGVLYITTPDNMWAVDARSGRQVWKY